MQSETHSTNPLLQDWTGPYGLPPFGTLQADHFLPTFERAFAQHLAELDAIAVNPEPPSLVNTLQALDESGRLRMRIAMRFQNELGL